MSFSLLAICCTYNRRDKTIRSVEQLLAQANQSQVNLSIMVVDNQSNDGTQEGLKGLGSRVQVVATPRNMYWSESMQFGFSQVKRNHSFDGFLAFNDDVDLFESSLSRLIGMFMGLKKTFCPELVLTASFISDASRSDITYGGFKKHAIFRPRLVRVSPSQRPARVDTCNMNLVLISPECVEAFGYPDGPYRHSSADLDYGLKVTSLGGAVFLAPGVYGVCPRNSLHGTWRDLNKPLRERWQLLCQPKGRPLSERWRFLRRNFGLVASPFVITPIIQLFTDEIRRAHLRLRRVFHK